jgi:hypothetical protein
MFADFCSWLVRANEFARPSFGDGPTEVQELTSQPDPGILLYPVDLGSDIIPPYEQKTASTLYPGCARAG